MPRLRGIRDEGCLGIKPAWETWVKRHLEPDRGDFGLDLRDKAGGEEDYVKEGCFVALWAVFGPLAAGLRQWEAGGGKRSMSKVF